MSTNHTTNYNLCQWEATDQVLRTDFNEDNAKIDAALGELSIAKALSKVAFYIGQQSITQIRQGRRAFSNYAMLTEAFDNPDILTLTGGAAVQNGVLTLSGTGATGTMTTPTYAIQKDNWTQARIWIHLQGGTAIPSINDVPLNNPLITSSTTVTGVSCLLYEYTMNVTTYGPSWGKVHLDLTCNNEAGLKVYDYCVFFF